MLAVRTLECDLKTEVDFVPHVVDFRSCLLGIAPELMK
jgi:hypothetical protein